NSTVSCVRPGSSCRRMTPGPLPLLNNLSDCSPVANVSSEKPRIALKVPLDMQHSDLRLVAEKADPAYFQQPVFQWKQALKRLDHLLDNLLRIAEYHHGLIHIEKVVVKAGVACGHAAFDHHNGARLVGFQYGHAIYGAARHVCCGVHYVV